MILGVLAPRAGQLFVDGTLGAGGHTEALLKAGAQVIGLDRDVQAIRISRRRLDAWIRPPSFAPALLRVVKENFRFAHHVLRNLEVAAVDGLLLDLGVSSMQLDQAERGFSFQSEGPLDMRMDQEAGITVIDLINTLDRDELSAMMHLLGDESRDTANKIATAIVQYRQAQPIRDTRELALLVERKVKRHGRRHPATRLFQALRIAVNDELGALAAILNLTPRLVKPGGRVAIISFHSLEDEMVKSFYGGTCRVDPSGQARKASQLNGGAAFREIYRGPIAPSAYEQLRNPRARSAKLRAYERL